MNECYRCSAKTQLPLCNRCAGQVKNILNHLPWWIDRLTETVIGQAALGTPERHTRREPKHLNGEDSPIDLFPDDDEEDLDEARRQRHRAARRQALAAGGINPPAAELLDAIIDMLTTWTRDLCESHRIAWTPLHAVRADFIGPLPNRWRRITANYTPTAADMTQWLAAHIHLIAGHQAADEFADELIDKLRAIKRIVNRPTPPRFIGPCPGSVNAGHDRDCHKPHPHNCGAALKAHRTAIEITCPICRTTHNVEHVANHLATRADAMRLTQKEILAMMDKLGTPIAERTWQKWRKEGRVKIRGYRRPNHPDGTRGAIGLTRRTTQDEPVYRVAEVRKLYATTIRHADALTCRKANL